jgi:hypothetical protein
MKTPARLTGLLSAVSFAGPAGRHTCAVLFAPCGLTYRFAM